MASYLDAIRRRDTEGHAFRAPVSPTELAAAQDRRWLLTTVDALATALRDGAVLDTEDGTCWNARVLTPRCHHRSCRAMRVALVRLATPEPKGETNG